MEIYLFRHGSAEDARAGRPDSARELTEEGREKTAAVARMARKTGVRPLLVLTSPYIRARQTARIAAQELECSEAVVSFDSLVPHGSPETVWRDLRDYSEQPALLLAGHEPLLGRLAAFLLNAPSLEIEMKKSALVRIDVESVRSAPRGILRWMIIPRMAQSL
jgi:phosphohistidine phosphatase